MYMFNVHETARNVWPVSINTKKNYTRIWPTKNFKRTMKVKISLYQNVRFISNLTIKAVKLWCKFLHTYSNIINITCEWKKMCEIYKSMKILYHTLSVTNSLRNELSWQSKQNKYTTECQSFCGKVTLLCIKNKNME